MPKSERQQPEFVRRSARWWPLLLVLLALADLKTEILLLLDHFTLTSLLFAIRHHVVHQLDISYYCWFVTFSMQLHQFVELYSFYIPLRARFG